ncbi:MAG: hypothetical protein ABI560_07880, partial [Myxococcales bacterium]
GTLFRCFRLLADDFHRKSGGGSTEPSSVATAMIGETQPAIPLADTRSWRWHTAQLLQCPLARQALAVAGQNPAATENTALSVGEAPRVHTSLGAIKDTAQ